MDISKFLSNIDLPATDEQQVETFLNSKGTKLQENILNLWNEHLLEEQVKISAETHDQASLLANDGNDQSSLMPAISDELNSRTIQRPAERDDSKRRDRPANQK